MWWTGQHNHLSVTQYYLKDLQTRIVCLSNKTFLWLVGSYIFFLHSDYGKLVMYRSSILTKFRVLWGTTKFCASWNHFSPALYLISSCKRINLSKRTLWWSFCEKVGSNQASPFRSSCQAGQIKYIFPLVS